MSKIYDYSESGIRHLMKEIRDKDGTRKRGWQEGSTSQQQRCAAGSMEGHSHT